MFLTKETNKINKLYSELKDLQEGKKILESAMHNNFYNRKVYYALFSKLNKQIEKINEKKEELKKEKSAYEKSR